MPSDITTVDEFQRIQELMDRTNRSGKELPEMMFQPFRTMLIQRMLLGIASGNKNVRAMATLTSNRFSKLDKEHQSRVLNLLSASNA